MDNAVVTMTEVMAAEVFHLKIHRIDYPCYMKTDETKDERSHCLLVSMKKVIKKITYISTDQRHSTNQLWE